jgi:hypothetical protein
MARAALGLSVRDAIGGLCVHRANLQRAIDIGSVGSVARDDSELQAAMSWRAARVGERSVVRPTVFRVRQPCSQRNSEHRLAGALP